MSRVGRCGSNLCRGSSAKAAAAPESISSLSHKEPAAPSRIQHATSPAPHAAAARARRAVWWRRERQRVAKGLPAVPGRQASTRTSARLYAAAPQRRQRRQLCRRLGHFQATAARHLGGWARGAKPHAARGCGRGRAGTGPLVRRCTASRPRTRATRLCRRTCSWASSTRTYRLRFAGARCP